MVTYRLGLDMGANSIGWCALRLDADGKPSGVLDAGVRILTPNEEAGRDPQSKASLAAARRIARGQRRRRKRSKRRRDRLMETLVHAGLMPTDSDLRKSLERLDPYWLRWKALDHRLRPCEVGRALFHLNQRRGFLSNRIADSDNDEKSAMKQGVKALEDRLEVEDARTLGELLAKHHGRNRFGRREKGEAARSVRFRPETKGAKKLYDFFPTRAMVEQEIDKIWEKQKEYHPDLLTDDLLGRIKRIVIEQRPLKKPTAGRCSLRPDEKRAPKAHPLFQRFRILQDVSQLRVVRPGRAERPLAYSQFRCIAETLSNQSALVVPFERLRRAIQLPDDARFNYERTSRKGFKTDETARLLANRKAFGGEWRRLDLERQVEIVERLLTEVNEEKLSSWLQKDCGLVSAAAEHICGIRLPQGHGQFGRSILRDLVGMMERESREAHNPDTGEFYRRPLAYDEAVESLGLHHSDHRPRELHARLPYYGEVLARHVIQRPDAPEGSQECIGRVPNPTVHIGLNQLRKIVNGLIDAYGPPNEISIELARELKWNKERKDLESKRNQENKEKNDEFRETLARLDRADTYENRLRLRLFHELPVDARVCIYSHTPISMEMIFSDDALVEIDHILPHSQTLDDSFSNKVLCTREMNQRKGNHAPEDAWSGDELREICERAECLLPKKAWRFAPGAMMRFEAEGGFLARQLTDTQHMSRLAKTYLEWVCEQVRASPGRVTAMLRAKWGLGSLLLPDPKRAVAGEKRIDHRHHAIDAFVIACTDTGLLNRIARASGKAEELNLDRLYPKGEFPTPFEGYREALGSRLESLVVSHRPDHVLPPGRSIDAQVTSGKLVEGTNYGLVNEMIDGKRFNLVTRKPIHWFAESPEKRIGQIRDADLRAQMQQVVQQARMESRRLKDALAEFGRKHGIRRIRVLMTEQSVRTVTHDAQQLKKRRHCRDGVNLREVTHVKACVPGDNHCIEIYELNGVWKGEGITVFDANQPDFRPAWRIRHPDARLVMRVHRGDLVEANFGFGSMVYLVCSLDAAANRLKLALHNEAGSLQKRHDDPDDPFRYEMKAYSKLKAAKAQIVCIDPTGRCRPAKREP